MATLWGHVMLSKKAFEQGAKIDAAALQQSHVGAQVELTCNGRGARWVLAPGDAAAPQFATVPLVDGEMVQLRVFVDRPPPPREEYPDARVLVVGAGGIGCELLKNLALLGIPHIETIDLDTIDGTNLNRQFLFQMEHVGKSKAAVAAEVVSSWGRPNVHIQGYAGNIKDTQYTDEFFSNFSIVINGLDNVSARKHVNRMCVAGSGVPLVESGTMGYNGQVQPIIKGRVECYDCSPKATEQKTFAVCTIHARPTTMVHCVHYAKELYARLFGDAIVMADEDSGGAVHQQQQKSEFDQLSVDAAASSDSVADLLYTALFVDKIKDMLALQTHWTIKPPVPLAPVNTLNTQSCAALGDLDKPDGPAQLLEQLRSSVAVAKARGRVPFDKDDDDAVRFVSAIANLRAATFHIANESLHRVKTIAGNIVPAIASTNAVIAACAVDAAMSILRGTVPDYVALRHVAQVRRRVVPAAAGGGARRRVKDQLLLHTIPAARPNPKCLVCSASDRTFAVQCNASMHSLATFVKGFLMREMGLVAPTVDHGSSTIYEHEDFEDLAGQPLSRWVSAGGGGATPLTVGDLHQSVEWTVHVSHNASLDETGFVSDWTPGASASSTTTTPQAASNGESAGVAHAEDDDVVAYHPAAVPSTGGRAKKAHRVEAEVVDDD